jgi:purine-binding chemotaxis protein CheW
MNDERRSAYAADRSAAQILHARAEALARPTQVVPRMGDSLEVLQFNLAGEAYAVETRHVVEVYPLKDLTTIPCTPAFIAGVVNVRGRLMPVIDIKKFFRLPEKGLTDLHRVILVRGSDIEFGILADVMVGTRSIAADELQPVLPTLTDIAGEYVKAVTSDRLVLLDLPRIMADSRINVYEEIESSAK